MQHDNLAAVNEAVNSLFVKAEEYRKLRESVDTYPNFDQIALAQQLENHELLEFRRISAHLYKGAKRFEKSIELSKKDELWQDATETANVSADQALAESLLAFFVDQKLFECFAAALYTCYTLIRPDVVLELSWRNNLMDFSMPFMIQTLREYDEKLRGIVAKLEAKDREEQEKLNAAKKAQEEQASTDASLVGPVGLFAPPTMLALPPAPGMGMGMGMGMYGAPGAAAYGF